MDKEIFNHLSNYSKDAKKIDRLITSAFVSINNIRHKKNTLIKANTIQKNDVDWEELQKFITLLQDKNGSLHFEELIELFEFVVSPADKIINGAIYTPLYIREYILFHTLNTTKKPLELAYFADLACGCGAFLYSLAIQLRQRTRLSYAKIYSKLFGLDITLYSVERTKILLTLLAISDGEDIESFSLNIYEGNALIYDFKSTTLQVRKNNGFDVIVGNPPYVSSRNMDQASLALIKKWEVSTSGHPDLYIPFFQIGFESLNNQGILGLITVNTFIKSVNGRALRNYFFRHKIDLTIINFGGEQIFKSRNTYTCICFLRKKEGIIFYKRIDSLKLSEINTDSFHKYSYSELDNNDGWNLVNSQDNKRFIERIEETGVRFKDKYSTRNGIATLKNHIYKFIPHDEDDNFYYLKTKKGKIYKIEKEICRDIINANKIKTDKDLNKNKEKVIFPYIQSNRHSKIICDRKFNVKFPNAYNYLLDNKSELGTRDKGKGEYEEWFAYGRRQSLDIHAYKLFFPHICERPTFIISTSMDLLFYNGIAVISDDLNELIVLKKILESDVFYTYIKSTTKDYSSGYISMSKNYIKNFGVIDLSDSDRKRLLNSRAPNKIVQELYGMSSKKSVREIAVVQQPIDKI